MSNLFKDCKDCPDRHVGCHADCEKSKQAHAKHDIIKKKQAKDREIDNYLCRTSAIRHDVYAKINMGRRNRGRKGF